jgi:hypothetical protein
MQLTEEVSTAGLSYWAEGLDWPFKTPPEEKSDITSAIQHTPRLDVM